MLLVGRITQRSSFLHQRLSGSTCWIFTKTEVVFCFVFFIAHQRLVSYQANWNKGSVYSNKCFGVSFPHQIDLLPLSCWTEAMIRTSLHRPPSISYLNVLFANKPSFMGDIYLSLTKTKRKFLFVFWGFTGRRWHFLTENEIFIFPWKIMVAARRVIVKMSLTEKRSQSRWCDFPSAAACIFILWQQVKAKNIKFRWNPLSFT